MEFPNIDTTISTTNARLPEFPINYTVEYDTSIVVRMDGTEKRLSNRKYPDKTFDIDYVFIKDKSHDRAVNYHEFAINEDGNEIIDWLTAQEIKGSTVIGPNRYLRIEDTTKFTIGQTVCLISGYDEYDAKVAKATIADVSTNGVAFTDIAGLTYYNRIAHILNVYTPNINVNQITDNKASADIKWLVKPGPRYLLDAIDPSFDYTEFTISEYHYNSKALPVFTFNQNWSEPPKYEIVKTNRRYGNNIFRFFEPERVNHKVFTINLTGNRNFLRQFEYFADYCKGRYRAFWFIPPINIIKITSRSTSLGTLYSVGVDYTSSGNQVQFANNDNEFNIGMILRIGSDDYTIISVNDSGLIVVDRTITDSSTLRIVHSVITIQTPFEFESRNDDDKFIGFYDSDNYLIRKITNISGNTITLYGNAPENFVYASQAALYRFNIDTFDYEYVTPFFGSIDVSMYELIDDTNTLVNESDNPEPTTVIITTCYNEQGFPVRDFEMVALDTNTCAITDSCPLRLYYAVNVNFNYLTSTTYSNLIEILTTETHTLEYQGAFTTKSYDYHHQTQTSTTSTHGVVVTKHLWEKNFLYVGNDDNEYTAKIVISVDERNSSTNENEGVYGPLINTFVLSDERNNDFVDTHAGYTWEYYNPIRTISGTHFFHPQLLNYFNVLTSYEQGCNDCGPEYFVYTTISTTAHIITRGGQVFDCDGIPDPAVLESFVNTTNTPVTTLTGLNSCTTTVSSVVIDRCNSIDNNCCKLIDEARGCCFSSDSVIEVDLKIRYAYLKLCPDTTGFYDWQCSYCADSPSGYELYFEEGSLEFSFDGFFINESLCAARWKHEYTETSISYIWYYPPGHSTPGWKIEISEYSLPGYSDWRQIVEEIEDTLAASNPDPTCLAADAGVLVPELDGAEGEPNIPLIVPFGEEHPDETPCTSGPSGTYTEDVATYDSFKFINATVKNNVGDYILPNACEVQGQYLPPQQQACEGFEIWVKVCTKEVVP